MMLRLLPRVVLGAVLLLNSCALLSQPGAGATVATLQGAAVDELSGLTVSRADPTVLWGHNDSGDGAVLYRIGFDGEDLGSTRIPGISAIDWEDIAAFDWNGKPALLIADVGDNKANRVAVTLYAVTDPGRTGDAKLLWQLDFHYADGPRDCESITVDPVDHAVILLTKREYPQRLYRLPLPTATPPVGVATPELLGEVRSIPRRSPLDQILHPGIGAFFGQPTALDLSPDGGRVLVVTYKDVLLYRRAPGQSWVETLNQTPEALAYGHLKQAEAGTFAPDGLSLFVSSEGLNAPLVRLPVKP